jgi:hypothetical protein
LFDLGTISFATDARAEFSPSESEAGTAHTQEEIAENAQESENRQIARAIATSYSIERISIEATEGESQSLSLSEYTNRFYAVIPSSRTPSFVSVEQDHSGDFILIIGKEAPAGEYRFPLVGLSDSGEYQNALDIYLSITDPAEASPTHP